jgi:anthranilate phosphoribosyltransferase
MNDPKTLKAFGQGIQRLIDGGNLGFEETYDMFRQVLANEQPDLHQGAFLAALVAKGETAEEIAAAWKAIMDFDTVTLKGPLPAQRVENSGTGMDALKTFNVSSAAAIVAAACGATVTRHGARALTSACGTVDILESVGVDVECDAGFAEESIRRENIGIFNGMSSKVHPNALGRILSQIRFGSTLNIAASLANPARPTHAVRGVYGSCLVDRVAEIMPSVGVRQGMVVHGMDDSREGGMDELSITGETVVREFGGAGLGASYRLRPEDVGLRTFRFESIAATGSAEGESIRFLQVLAGRNQGACIDFTCLNAAAVLYVVGLVDSLESGVTRSREAIERGAALEKLRAWVAVQNAVPGHGLSRLERAAERAGIR